MPVAEAAPSPSGTRATRCWRSARPRARRAGSSRCWPSAGAVRSTSTPTTCPSLTTLAEQCGLATERARLYELAARELEERKASQQTLLEVNARKDELLAMLAHALRNPLAPILDVADLLARRPVSLDSRSSSLRRPSACAATSPGCRRPWPTCRTTRSSSPRAATRCRWHRRPLPRHLPAFAEHRVGGGRSARGGSTAAVSRRGDGPGSSSSRRSRYHPLQMSVTPARASDSSFQPPPRVATSSQRSHRASAKGRPAWVPPSATPARCRWRGADRRSWRGRHRGRAAHQVSHGGQDRAERLWAARKACSSGHSMARKSYSPG